MFTYVPFETRVFFNYFLKRLREFHYNEDNAIGAHKSVTPDNEYINGADATFIFLASKSHIDVIIKKYIEDGK